MSGQDAADPHKGQSAATTMVARGMQAVEQLGSSVQRALDGSVETIKHAAQEMASTATEGLAVAGNALGMPATSPNPRVDDYAERKAEREEIAVAHKQAQDELREEMRQGGPDFRSGTLSLDKVEAQYKQPSLTPNETDGGYASTTSYASLGHQQKQPDNVQSHETTVTIVVEGDVMGGPPVRDDRNVRYDTEDRMSAAFGGPPVPPKPQGNADVYRKQNIPDNGISDADLVPNVTAVMVGDLMGGPPVPAENTMSFTSAPDGYVSPLPTYGDPPVESDSRPARYYYNTSETHLGDNGPSLPKSPDSRQLKAKSDVDVDDLKLKLGPSKEALKQLVPKTIRREQVNDDQAYGTQESGSSTIHNEYPAFQSLAAASEARVPPMKPGAALPHVREKVSSAVSNVSEAVSGVVEKMQTPGRHAHVHTGHTLHTGRSKL